jgi:hypothetical protein
MQMPSFYLKIRHVFADTSLTERFIGAGPPVIIQLNGSIPAKTVRAKNAGYFPLFNCTTLK